MNIDENNCDKIRAYILQLHVRNTLRGVLSNQDSFLDAAALEFRGAPLARICRVLDELVREGLVTHGTEARARARTRALLDVANAVRSTPQSANGWIFPRIYSEFFESGQSSEPQPLTEYEWVNQTMRAVITVNAPASSDPPTATTPGTCCECCRPARVTSGDRLGCL